MSETLQFVDEYIDQFIAWDLLVYFHESPEIERKPAGVAVDIGRKSSVIQPCLDALVEKGVLTTEADEADEPTYRYVADAMFKKRMDAFLAFTRDRTNRLAIVSRVLQKETKRL
jgi:predicted transcriptional regulator